MFLVLPANASPKEFPNNKNSSYKVRLAERLKLEGSKWECALVDMFYSNNWHNVTQGVLTVIQISDGNDGNPPKMDRFHMRVRQGRYDSLADLLKEIHDLLKLTKLDNAFELVWDEVRDLMFLKFNVDQTPYYAVSFAPDLAEILGFRANHTYLGTPSGQRQYQTTVRPDLHQGFMSLYVYCSLCENRAVGHDTAPLLRVLPVRRSSDDRNV